MNQKTLAVIGLGSMGSRRIRLLNIHYPGVNIVGVDSQDSRRTKAEESFSISVFENLEQAQKSSTLDAVLVCTSPITHEVIIREALGFGLNVFTEINLLNNYYDEVIELAKNKGCKLYLSSTLLHREEIAYIQESIANDNKVSYRYHVGQYLPDWHPWENYKDFFVSDKRTNGCREIFAIELPWIIKTFGKVLEFSVEKQKISSLSIDYPDNYQLLIKHESGIVGVLSVNIVSRVAKRELQIIGEQTQITWTGTPDSLMAWDESTKKMLYVPTYDDPIHQSGYAANILENAYLSELNEFLGLLQDTIDSVKYSFEEDNYIIDLINRIEKGI